MHFFLTKCKGAARLTEVVYYLIIKFYKGMTL